MGRRAAAIAVVAVALGSFHFAAQATAFKEPPAWRHLSGIGLPKKIRCCFRYEVLVDGVLSADFGQSQDADRRGKYQFRWGFKQRGIDLFPVYHGHHDALLFPLARAQEAHLAYEVDNVEVRHQTYPSGDFVYTAEPEFFHCPPYNVDHHFAPVRRADLTPLFYWNLPNTVGILRKLDRRQLPGHGCDTYFKVSAVAGPLYGDPRWGAPYQIPAPGYAWATSGKGSRTLVCTVTQFAPQGGGSWQFKGVREAYVKVTYFPYSQLAHYERVLQQHRSQDAYQLPYPNGWQGEPFGDAERNPSAPFGPNNPSNGCHPA
jgi:hypothetical protein